MAVDQLNGTIPTELSQLTSLEYLDMWGNQLTGTISTYPSTVYRRYMVIFKTCLLSEFDGKKKDESSRADNIIVTHDKSG
jgi:hypothetical protein